MSLLPVSEPDSMMALFGSAFVTFLVIIDPPGCVPIFAGLTRGNPDSHRRAMALRSVVISWFVLMLFALFGQPLLRALGISLASFRIAGGIMLFAIAIDMVFEKRTQRREDRAQSIEGTPEAEDISVFPMAIPMIAGPGSIASAMLLVSRAHSYAGIGLVLSAMTLVVAVTGAALLSAGWLMRLMGERIETMISRLLGVILAALAAQFVVDGIRESFPSL